MHIFHGNVTNLLYDLTKISTISNKEQSQMDPASNW